MADVHRAAKRRGTHPLKSTALQARDTEAGQPSVAIALLIILLALLVAITAVRLTVAGHKPELAPNPAPQAPDPLASRIMLAVGEAAAAGGDPSEETMERLRLLAVTSPLRPEPFLVQGALAARAGDHERAGKLLAEARSRAPRAAAARYLLSEVWLRQGRTREALREIAILARLFPNASVPLVAALSEYARTPGAAQELVTLLNENPQLREPVLETLASDPANASLVVRIASSTGASGSRSQVWQSRLLRGLVDRKAYDRAYRLWQQFAGIRNEARPLIFNGTFERLGAPPPFNWSYGSSSAGLAEPADGKLRVLYYGRQNAVLASQLLLLEPGRYRFSAPVEGQLPAGALVWSVRCVEGGKNLMELRVAAGPAAVDFTVPQSGCPAQMLNLIGSAQDMPEDTDVRIGPAKIQRNDG